MVGMELLDNCSWGRKFYFAIYNIRQTKSKIKMSEKWVVILQVILFIGLLISYYYVSVNNKDKPFMKWAIAGLSISILFLSDKLKLLLFGVSVGVLWIIKHFTTKKENNGRAT